MGSFTIDLTTVLAVWGAVLSTILAVREFTKDRLQVKVMCEARKRRRAPLVSLGDEYPTETYETILITVLNSGHRQVDIVRLCFDFGDIVLDQTDVSSNSDVELPHSLVAGESLQIEYYVFVLEEALKYAAEKNATAPLELRRIFVKDATRKEWSCKLPPILAGIGPAE